MKKSINWLMKLIKGYDIMKKIVFEGITYPEIDFEGFCMCGEDKCEKNVYASIKIIAEIKKEKLSEFVDMLLYADKNGGLDAETKITIESKQKGYELMVFDKYISKRWKCRTCGFDSESYNDVVNHISENHRDKI